MFDTLAVGNSFDQINDGDLLNLDLGRSDLGILPKSKISTKEASLSLGWDFPEIESAINSYYQATSVDELSHTKFAIDQTADRNLDKAVDSLTQSALSDANNSLSTPANLAAVYLPDLIVQSTVSAPSYAAAGSSIQVSYQVENQGNANAGYSYTKFYLSQDL